SLSAKVPDASVTFLVVALSKLPIWQAAVRFQPRLTRRALHMASSRSAVGRRQNRSARVGGPHLLTRNKKSMPAGCVRRSAAIPHRARAPRSFLAESYLLQTHVIVYTMGSLLSSGHLRQVATGRSGLEFSTAANLSEGHG